MIGTRARHDALDARRVCDELFVMWSAARAEANDAYDDWCGNRGTEAYAVFLAAEDRADAAEREYASACRSLPVAAL
jgi:hypothetical protein